MKANRKQIVVLITVFILLAFFAYREFFQIYVLAYVGRQNIWHSRRFISFLIISIVSVVLLLSSLKKVLNSQTEFQHAAFSSRLPIGLRRTLILFFAALFPLVFWFFPLPEKFEFGYWMMSFLTYTVALVCAWLLGEDDYDQNLILSTGILWMVGGGFYAIFSRLVL